MTLFIVFLSITNIALGYALAVYLGHGQLPWRFGLVRLRRKAKTPPIEKTAEEDGSKQKADDPKPRQQEVSHAEEPTAEDAAKTVPAVDQAEKAPIEKPSAEVEPEAEPAETIVAEPPQHEDDKVEVAASREEEPLTEKKPIEAAVEEEPLRPAARGAAEETEPAAARPAADGEVDDKFLEGIEAFQNQLHGDDESPEASPEETAEDPEAEVAPVSEPEESAERKKSSAHDDVLQGIEAFRAQLASMQQKPVPAAEEATAEEEEEVPVG